MVYIVVIAGFIAATIALWRSGHWQASVAIGAAPALVVAFIENHDRLEAGGMATQFAFSLLALLWVFFVFFVFAGISMAAGLISR